MRVRDDDPPHFEAMAVLYESAKVMIPIVTGLLLLLALTTGSIQKDESAMHLAITRATWRWMQVSFVAGVLSLTTWIAVLLQAHRAVLRRERGMEIFRLMRNLAWGGSLLLVLAGSTFGGFLWQAIESRVPPNAAGISARPPG